ncbi:double-strand-break repair protein rad21-like protein [Dinothrombium tinctorium]|uniref:Double-strand-break repair protein rad21-like protein n=1 Tax=Dinothrombium tinctorium TaxID=1965070 RepID=A0A3S3QPV9_9ACAR|nr:double-strand-break repair protein rad21-like protein [Dinothrombium tinctorium]RWS11855.1 double-strand-break repair protein rad21-like protein [Dinothrombium tinctorium]RWS12130.1 double-strand-break repair protein rad21-like protein [Dinothrombium tinctorium]RWS12356.1 double-strand-break repair protein rad21-like protein [Dinothrombium tinctorium]
MFYSVFVLGKKGPLARVWLAAHWDKKITKAQILETNIVESVDSILQPRVRLSLRTSSHLLLGIVRIYSRKTMYLLQDCQDAAFKIKSAFRPGAVDLPDSKSEAAISAITLPEMLDFVNDFDLIAEPPIQIEPLQTNANIRNITLVEEMSSIHVDDPLLSEVREWADFSSVQGVDTSKSLQDSSTQGQQPQKGAHPLDIFDRPPVDDGFGGPLGIGDVDDMFALPVPPEAQEQMQAEQQQQKEGEPGVVPEDQERPTSRLSEASSMSYGAPLSAAPSGPPSTPGSVPPPQDEEMLEEPQREAQPTGEGERAEAPAEDGVFRRPENATQDTMVLEPLEGPGLERRRKRRKKLGIIIDEVKTLSGEEMKAQLSDTSDIVTTLDLAPPSKKLMHWKKTGGSEKLFSLPERPIPSKILFVYYSRNLITNRIETEEPIQDDLLNGEVPEMRAEAPKMPGEEPQPEFEDYQQRLPPPSPLKEIQPPKTPRTPRREFEHKSPAKKKRKTAEEKAKERQEKLERTAQKERISNHLEDFEITDTSLPQFRASGRQPSDIKPDIDMTFHPEPEEEEDHFEFEQPMSVGPPEEMMPDETAEQYEERMRNKRTNVLLRFMSNQLDEEGSVSFSRLVHHNRRKQVAQKFFSLLVLKKQQAIELYQDTDVEYGEITITKGPRYDEALATSSL